MASWATIRAAIRKAGNEAGRDKPTDVPRLSMEANEAVELYRKSALARADADMLFEQAAAKMAKLPVSMVGPYFDHTTDIDRAIAEKFDRLVD